MRILNKEAIAEVPRELSIKTTSLEQALRDYPKDGGVLLHNYEQLVMETPARGRILCNVTLTITVQSQLE